MERSGVGGGVTLRQVALASWFTTIFVSSVALVIAFATRDIRVPTAVGFRGSYELVGLTFGTVGTIVALRRPENLNGWLFCAIGVMFGALALMIEYLTIAVLVPLPGLPFTVGVSWLVTWVWVVPMGCAFIFLPLLFPTGSLLSRRWRPVAALGGMAIAAFSAAAAFLPGPIQQAPFLVNPYGANDVGIAAYGTTVVGPAAFLFLAASLLAVASLVVRFNRAVGDARLQIKWLALAAVFAIATFTLDTVARVAAALTNAERVAEVIGTFGIVVFLGIPIAAGMAITRYRLYEIDRIISRTIGWAIVTGLLVGTFALLVVGLQAVIEPLTGGNTLAIAGSTLVVAALFAPVRSRVQQTVDRRFDRSRYDGERLLASFGERLRDEVDLATISADARVTVDAAVRPAHVGLWLRGGSGDVA